MKKITEEQKNKAVDVYAEKGNLIDAAKAIGMSSRTLLRERKRCASFKKLMGESRELYCEEIRRKMHNLTEDRDAKHPQFLAIMAQARAHMDEYRDKIDHKVEGGIRIITGVPRPKKEGK